MQMHEQLIMVDGQEQPISRTYQYRKVSVIVISYRQCLDCLIVDFELIYKFVLSLSIYTHTHKVEQKIEH